ncbi:hypothetical protein ACOSQ4_002989 [Xanthoceras sorbifolium]
MYRVLPMLTMMENIRRKLMKRIHKRHEAVLKWDSAIPPTINKFYERDSNIEGT